MLKRLLFSNLKLVYRFSQWMRNRFTTNGMLILLIMPVAGIFGFDTRSTLSFQIFSITFILILISLTHSIFFRGCFSIKRILPEYGTVGIPLQYSCSVNNLNKKAKKGLVLIDSLHTNFPTLSQLKNARDPLDQKRSKVDRLIGYPRLVSLIQKFRGGTIKPATINYIAHDSSESVNLTLLPLRRGHIYFKQIKLAQADPLGIYQAHKNYNNNDKLLILPKIYDAPVLSLPGSRTYQRGGINNAGTVGDSQEFISLREYRSGDPLKSIHWRSFAKTNKPVVKDFQDEFFIRYGLVLDTWLDNYSPELFEAAISIAASFMSKQQQADSIMDLMFIEDKAYRFSSGRNTSNTRNILEILACLEASQDNNLDKLDQMVKQHYRECSALIIVLLTLDEDRLRLLKKFSQYSLPMKIFYLTEDDQVGELNNEGLDIHRIRTTHIQDDLNNAA